MSKIVFNISKLHDFRDSKYCPDTIKELDDNELYNTISANENLQLAYEQFCYQRWYNEYLRRIDIAKNKTQKPTLEDRLRLKQQLETLENIKEPKRTQQNGPKQKPLYIELFGDRINESDWTNLELAVRQQFLQEVEEAKKQGGCSGCKKNILVRKYMQKLKELLTD